MRIASVLGGLLVASALSVPAWGVATINSSNRSVTAEAGGIPNSQVAVPVDGQFNAAVIQNDGSPNLDNRASASQQSDIEPLLFDAVGAGEVHGNGEVNVHANSFFEVFFDLATPHAYSLSGLLDTGVDGGLSAAMFLLEPVGGPPIALFLAADNSAAANITGNGVLDPGSYHLRVDGDTLGDIGFADAFFQFEATVTLRELDGAIPEPITPVLAAMGLAALSLRVTRRR
jgi:hypothetical protein